MMYFKLKSALVYLLVLALLLSVSILSACKQTDNAQTTSATPDSDTVSVTPSNAGQTVSPTRTMETSTNVLEDIYDVSEISLPKVEGYNYYGLFANWIDEKSFFVTLLSDEWHTLDTYPVKMFMYNTDSGQFKEIYSGNVSDSLDHLRVKTLSDGRLAICGGRTLLLFTDGILSKRVEISVVNVRSGFYVLDISDDGRSIVYWSDKDQMVISPIDDQSKKEKIFNSNNLLLWCGDKIVQARNVAESLSGLDIYDTKNKTHGASNLAADNLGNIISNDGKCSIYRIAGEVYGDEDIVVKVDLETKESTVLYKTNVAEMRIYADSKAQNNGAYIPEPISSNGYDTFIYKIDFKENTKYLVLNDPVKLGEIFPYSDGKQFLLSCSINGKDKFLLLKQKSN